MDISGVRGEDAIAFMVAGTLVYGIVAAACSSPQTTEINADERSDTLMKWVYLGLGQSAIFVAIGAHVSNSPKAVVGGGALAAGLMLASYVHAKNAGLKDGKPGTEH